jgi:hypothetical protein
VEEVKNAWNRINIHIRNNNIYSKKVGSHKRIAVHKKSVDSSQEEDKEDDANQKQDAM